MKDSNWILLTMLASLTIAISSKQNPDLTFLTASIMMSAYYIVRQLEKKD